MPPKTQMAVRPRLWRIALFVAGIALVGLFANQAFTGIHSAAAQANPPDYHNLIFQEEFDAPLDIDITGAHKWRPGWIQWGTRYLVGNLDKAYKVRRYALAQKFDF